MGIHGLWKVIHSKYKGKPCKLSDFAGKTLAMDIPYYMHKFLHDPSVDGYLGQFKSLIDDFKKHSIKPVMVFDGKHPELKEEEHKRRKAAREEAEKDLQRMQEELKQLKSSYGFEPERKMEDQLPPILQVSEEKMKLIYELKSKEQAIFQK